MQYVCPSPEHSVAIEVSCAKEPTHDGYLQVQTIGATEMPIWFEMIGSPLNYA